MRACACLAIAMGALAGCAPDSWAWLDASFLAGTDMAAARSHCAVTAVTPEDYANCLASRWTLNACDGIGGSYDDCIAAERGAAQESCAVHVVFSKYFDCVAIAENRIGGWPWTLED